MRHMPQSFLGSSPAPPTGLVDFRLARQSVLNEYRKGRLSRTEVCDAHPELVRAARNIGEQTDEACPICEKANLVLVSYAFGPQLPPSGQCIASSQEFDRLSRRQRQLACYVVEVCPECSWNHLARTFPLGKPRRG